MRSNGSTTSPFASAPDLTAEIWRTGTLDAPDQRSLPDVDERALAGLKFNEALPDVMDCRRPLRTTSRHRPWPAWTKGHLHLAEPEQWLSPAEITEEGHHRLLRPRLRLTSLHPENFPLPRFPLAISDLARAARATLLGRVELMDMQLSIRSGVSLLARGPGLLPCRHPPLHHPPPSRPHGPDQERSPPPALHHPQRHRPRNPWSPVLSNSSSGNPEFLNSWPLRAGRGALPASTRAALARTLDPYNSKSLGFRGLQAWASPRKMCCSP
jgi:hypothetical protein